MYSSLEVAIFKFDHFKVHFVHILKEALTSPILVNSNKMLSKEEITNGLYHYSPNKGAAILFAVLYGVSFLIHEEQYR